MKVFLFATILQSFAIVGFGQNKVSPDTSNCGTLLNRLSENWKLDSTGNNGFRRENTKYLLSCKQLLLKYLGKLNQTRETNKGKEFLYHNYDFRTFPKGEDGPLAYLYIAFTIPDGQEYVSNTAEGDTDL